MIASNSDYTAHIERLATKARAWLDTHPGATPKLQWNFPQNAAIIATIGVAIEHHFVGVNDDGQALLDAMCAGLEPREEPTVLMIRAALEVSDLRSRLAFGEEHSMPSHECPVCSTRLDKMRGVGHDDDAKPGDITLCIGCGAILAFDATFRPVIPDQDVLRTIEQENPDDWQVITTIQRIIREQKDTPHLAYERRTF